MTPADGGDFPHADAGRPDAARTARRSCCMAAGRSCCSKAPRRRRRSPDTCTSDGARSPVDGRMLASRDRRRRLARPRGARRGARRGRRAGRRRLRRPLALRRRAAPRHRGRAAWPISSAAPARTDAHVFGFLVRHLLAGRPAEVGRGAGPPRLRPRLPHRRRRPRRLHRDRRRARHRRPLRAGLVDEPPGRRRDARRALAERPRRCTRSRSRISTATTSCRRAAASSASARTGAADRVAGLERGVLREGRPAAAARRGAGRRACISTDDARDRARRAHAAAPRGARSRRSRAFRRVCRPRFAGADTLSRRRRADRRSARLPAAGARTARLLAIGWMLDPLHRVERVLVKSTRAISTPGSTPTGARCRARTSARGFAQDPRFGGLLDERDAMHGFIVHAPARCDRSTDGAGLSRTRARRRELPVPPARPCAPFDSGERLPHRCSRRSRPTEPELGADRRGAPRAVPRQRPARIAARRGGAARPAPIPLGDRSRPARGLAPSCRSARSPSSSRCSALLAGAPEAGLLDLALVAVRAPAAEMLRPLGDAFRLLRPARQPRHRRGPRQRRPRGSTSASRASPAPKRPRLDARGPAARRPGWLARLLAEAAGLPAPGPALAGAHLRGRLDLLRRRAPATRLGRVCALPGYAADLARPRRAAPARRPAPPRSRSSTAPRSTRAGGFSGQPLRRRLRPRRPRRPAAPRRRRQPGARAPSNSGCSTTRGRRRPIRRSRSSGRSTPPLLEPPRPTRRRPPQHEGPRSSATPTRPSRSAARRSPPTTSSRASSASRRAGTRTTSPASARRSRATARRR